ncbi:hypothetical protein BDW68DRAFT_175489 [Aspergillus falconensis]
MSKVKTEDQPQKWILMREASGFSRVDLENRRRVKLIGKITAGLLNVTEEDERVLAGIAHLTAHLDDASVRIALLEIGSLITVLLGNCPKYLNTKCIVLATPDLKLISKTSQLHPEPMELSNRADSLFISTSHGNKDTGTNIRGGPPGFVRVLSNEPGGAVTSFLILKRVTHYPSQSQRRLYTHIYDFTIPGHVPHREFGITIQKQGNVTRYLFQTSESAGFEVPLKGFGGDFRLPAQNDGIPPFIAGGIGITLVLAQLPVFDISLLRLIWPISFFKDIALVLNTFKLSNAAASFHNNVCHWARRPERRDEF